MKFATPLAKHGSNMKLINAVGVGHISDLRRRLPLIVRAVAVNDRELVLAKLVTLRAPRRSVAKSLDDPAATANFTKQSTKRIYGTHK